MKALGSFLLLLALLGCTHTRVVTEYKEVKVPVAVKLPPLPLPNAPERQTDDTDANNTLAYIRAMTADLLNAWKYTAELVRIITTHNEAIKKLGDQNPSSGDDIR